MIKRSHELQAEVFPQRFGGKGEAVSTKLLTLAEMQGKGRLLARTLLKPGCSIGLHQHKGDCEAYYILCGEGLADDNGTPVAIKAGDVLFTADGQIHSLENTGTADLEYIALVLYV